MKEEGIGMESYVLEQMKVLFEELELRYHCDGKGRIGVRLNDYCLMFYAEEDGEVAFRIYTDLSLKSGVDESRVLQVMKKGMNAADAFRDGMIKISLGADTPKALFEEAMEILSM